MHDLTRTIIDIKDPFALCAFAAVVLLIAFRTRSVPESVFRLLHEKITRERFSALLDRGLRYTFMLFLALCGIAVVGQVIGYMTTVHAATVDELRAELAERKADAAASRAAIDAYQRSVELAQQNRVGEAIASLEASIKAVPTATARETLALLHHQVGDTRRATESAEQAVSAAREGGDRARAERVLGYVSTPRPVAVGSCPAGAGLIGSKLDLPPGGDTFETAPVLAQCVYRGATDTDRDKWKYYKIAVRTGQTVSAAFRLRDTDLAWWSSLTVRLHGAAGEKVAEISDSHASALQRTEYKVKDSGFVYISVNNTVRDSVFEFAVR